MKIGFVSTWFERGAAYVTKAYISLLEKENDIYVYARGEEMVKSEGWNQDYVTKGRTLPGTKIDIKHFEKWIIGNELEVIFFNEQWDFVPVLWCKRNYPNIKLGAYIDYYKIDTVHLFKYYDFLICNTKRHYSVFEWHKQVFYVPWGTQVELFKPTACNDTSCNNKKVRFFHSAGMSERKGTKQLIETFIGSELCEKAELIIHTQLPLSRFTGLEVDELRKKNVIVIEKTVSAPGLYFMGDVYVYPTTLDGLGLTLYEALSSGLPVITTNAPPMNEVVDENVGRLVSVERQVARGDAYYWPLSFVDEEDLFEQMMFYVNNREELEIQKKRARNKAIKEYDFEKQRKQVCACFEESCIHMVDAYEVDRTIKKIKKGRRSELKRAIVDNLPVVLASGIMRIREWRNK